MKRMSIYEYGQQSVAATTTWKRVLLFVRSLTLRLAVWRTTRLMDRAAKRRPTT